MAELQEGICQEAVGMGKDAGVSCSDIAAACVLSGGCLGEVAFQQLNQCSETAQISE